jgi:hypothetical protein
MPEGKGQEFFFYVALLGPPPPCQPGYRQALYACLLHTEKKDAESRNDVAVIAVKSGGPNETTTAK